MFFLDGRPQCRQELQTPVRADCGNARLEEQRLPQAQSLSGPRVTLRRTRTPLLLRQINLSAGNLKEQWLHPLHPLTGHSVTTSVKQTTGFTDFLSAGHSPARFARLRGGTEFSVSIAAVFFCFFFTKTHSVFQDIHSRMTPVLYQRNLKVSLKTV